MAGAGELLMPLRDAMRLAVRWPPLLAWLISFAMGAAIAAAVPQSFFELDPIELVGLGVLGTIGPIIVSGGLIFFLSRSLLMDAAGYGRPLYGRFVGLYVLAAIMIEVVDFAGSLAILTAASSPLVLLYGPPLVGGLASVVVFPLWVRCFATAAGIEEPRLGGVWSFVFDAGRGVYFWYAVCAVGFSVLGAVTFANLLPVGTGNDLPGNLVLSAIAATAQILRSMLDIVAVKMVATGWQDDVEVFA